MYFTLTPNHSLTVFMYDYRGRFVTSVPKCINYIVNFVRRCELVNDTS